MAKQTKAGIWQGRFQPVHNGHNTMFARELHKFDEQFIAIVNPNPSIPPITGFDNFSSSNNPFTYFQRMMLWKGIIDNYNTTHLETRSLVSLVPCWHARKFVALENEFLPVQADRAWIIPTDRDSTEENKAKELISHGENIYEVECDKKYINVTATYIRKHLAYNDGDAELWLPECVKQLTKQFLFKEETSHEFYIVPFIGDKLDLFAIQHAVNQTKEKPDSYIVFALTVKVSSTGRNDWKNEDDLPWWFQEADHSDENNQITFYRKSRMINELMKQLNLNNYLITPIFVKGTQLNALKSYNEAFLPPTTKSKWIIKSNRSHLYGFIQYLTNMEARKEYIPGGLELDETIKTFFLDSDNSIYAEECVTDSCKKPMELKIKLHKATLEKWAASNTSGAQNHLDSLLEIEKKLKTAAQSDLKTLDDELQKIIKWIGNNQ